MSETIEKPSASGNAAELRNALKFAERELTAATQDETFGTDALYLVGCMRTVAKRCRAVLSMPPRNCDRFDGEIGLLRDACFRERGLNPGEDFSEVFCKWLLEPVKEEEWVKMLKVLTNNKTKGADDER